VHTELPDAEVYVPVEQLKQAFDEVLPVVPEYKPAAQLMHVAASENEYCPDGHAMGSVLPVGQ
jgi:hypothetical protein